MGSDLYFASGSGLSAVTQDEPKLECLSLDEVIRGGFTMPVLDIVITQYLDSSYRGSLGTGSARVQCFCLVPGQSTALYSLLCSSFKVASDKTKAGD